MSTTPRAPRLDLEGLSDRLVPAVLLTTAGAEARVDDAIVRQCDAQPTGTGVIRSFVRVQGAAPGGGTQQGYNTDARPLAYDENKSPVFTRSLTLGQVPRVTVDGVKYREFLLDINQKASASRLSLDEVQIYTHPTGSPSGYVTATKLLAGQTPRWGTTTSVLLDARLNSGSGSGDMTLLVPDSRFTGAKVTDFVTLYSRMGGVAGASANGGFEEWAVKTTGDFGAPPGEETPPPPAPPPPAPPPPAVGTGKLSGRVFLEDNQAGIGGVTVHLAGVDVNGNTVTLLARTGDGVDSPLGCYEFTGLLAGTYTIWEDQPAGYADGTDYVGFVDGAERGATDGNDRIVAIALESGQVGVEYNFGEWLPVES